MCVRMLGASVRRPKFFRGPCKQFSYALMAAFLPCPRPSSPQPAAAPGGFGVVHLLLVALLAFLIGHFANVALPLLTEKLKQLQQQQ